ncbi:unnamed protein product [Cylicostephanus goldi]|uniref:BTB domain-containing protein n=1 Tax=Cylicostephanus goldi TaxID=71465 RepID=A0A3P7PY42_CYLGO|nr:unnamed protein product [Cylicostephanus goldi]
MNNHSECFQSEKDEFSSYSERVRINVGGTIFETSLCTLTRVNDTLLSAMVGRWRNSGELFIDRDPTYFAKILNYLRDSESFYPPEDDEARECLRREAKFYNIPGLVTMCLPDVIGYGDSVQWKISAIDTYWKSFVRFQYYSKRQAKCMACGSNVYGYVGPTTEANGMVMVDGKVMNKVLLINYAEWLPLKHHMKVIKGYVLQLNSTCCRVKWGRDLETHLPKSALRLAKSR